MTAKIKTMRYSADAAKDVLDFPNDKIYDGNRKGPVHKTDGAVSAEHISFAYGSNSPPVIRDFSLDLKPGSSAAVVGASGSGKSTVAKLISGVYRPQKGSVSLDGKK